MEMATLEASPFRKRVRDRKGVIFCVAQKTHFFLIRAETKPQQQQAPQQQKQEASQAQRGGLDLDGLMKQGSLLLSQVRQRNLFSLAFLTLSFKSLEASSLRKKVVSWACWVVLES